MKLTEFVEALNAKHAPDYAYAISMGGKKYARIVQYSGSGQNLGVFCFVEFATGNIFKPASWKAPAEGVRNNLSTVDIAQADPFGRWLYHGYATIARATSQEKPMTLDTKDMLVVRTNDGLWRYADHTSKIMTAGFGSREALERNSSGFLNTTTARSIMERRYVDEYESQPTVSEALASRHNLPGYQAVAVLQLVNILRSLQGSPTGEDDVASDRDASIRHVVKTALKELGVYDAGGCPLCLS